MKNYKLVNNIVGWLCFAIAAFTYVSTIESTASFWDCGEFIASAYKLEVGHPPGNPIFMLTANLFSQLAPDKHSVGVMINVMSALFSALTILFLFWTITHLTRKLVIKDENSISLSQLILVMGAGAVGALAYTFSDTFWFSAVEGEVYAFSSLMTALVFWLILKWESVADQPHADRWIILIAYLMGLSIAVHLLNLLCIPAIVLVYYFKKYDKPSLKGTLVALVISFGIIITILYGLIQGLVEVCGWFELLFVNGFGMPYNSGVAFYVILVFAVLAWSMWETMRNNPNALRIKISFIIAIVLLGIPFIGSGYILGALIIIGLSIFLFSYKKINPVVLNSILISLFVITIGYSSYALIMIRSTAATPMNQNDPKDIFTLRTYLAREQYGDTPLFYGHTYVAELKRDSKGAPVTEDLGPVWTRIPKKDSSEKDRYFVSNRKKEYVYMNEFNMLFPRMYSPDPNHISVYKQWGQIKGKPVRINLYGESTTVTQPTFGENIRFFIQYQLNFMYWRYFMWNFSGRQNDIQGYGDVANGNWITGIKFLDELRVGPQDDMPHDITQNKGHNKYYALPLLLGLLGIAFQAFFTGKKGIESFWATFTLFFMTGIAIVIYLNQTPLQPRERDYAYAGSFYAFCIWIGLGVPMIFNLLRKFAKAPEVAASVAASVLCLLIPVLMASQNWDDHTRSGRYVARDFGQNYLTTCEPNSIIFTNGDNDTFPLWYNQEVEGYRTDVRVCNLSYLQTDWYIDQMKLQAYESDPLPIDWHKWEYIQGTHDAAWFKPKTDKPLDLATVLDFIKTDDARFKEQGVDIVPTRVLTLDIDSAAVIKSGLVKPENGDWIPKQMVFDFSQKKDENGKVIDPGKSYLGKHEMMILDMLKNNRDWSRPIYYAVTVNSDQYLNMQNYFRQDGVIYRVVPFNAAQHEPVNTDKMFDVMMNKYKWGGIENPDVYLDENALRMAKTFRQMFSNLVDGLIKEGKNDKAEQALDYCQKVIPYTTVKYDYSAADMADGYFRLGKKEKALEVCDKVAEHTMSNLRWYNRLKPDDFASIGRNMVFDLRTMQNILYIYQQIDPKLMEKYLNDFNACASRYSAFEQRGGRGGVNR